MQIQLLGNILVLCLIIVSVLVVVTNVLSNPAQHSPAQSIEPDVALRQWR